MINKHRLRPPWCIGRIPSFAHAPRMQPRVAAISKGSDNDRINRQRLSDSFHTCEKYAPRAVVTAVSRRKREGVRNEARAPLSVDARDTGFTLCGESRRSPIGEGGALGSRDARASGPRLEFVAAVARGACSAEAFPATPSEGNEAARPAGEAKSARASCSCASCEAHEAKDVTWGT